MSIVDTAWDTVRLAYRWMALEFSRSPRTTTQEGKQHLALFAWALPPNSNAGVFRPLSFIRYGHDLGWQIDAFRGGVPSNQGEHGEELLARIPADVKLHEVKKLEEHPAYRLTPQIDGGFLNALSYAEHAIQCLSDDPPDVVFASGPPFFVFVSAYFVAKHFSIPLILDYRDEWSECPFDFVSAGNDDRYWEKRCLAAADAVFFTTQSHLDHQICRFPELTVEKAVLVPNGWEADDFNVQNRQSLPNSGVVNVAHIGNLAGHTPPHEFLDSLAELMSIDAGWRERISLSFIGRRSSSAHQSLQQFPFQSSVTVVDHVGKQEANRRMQEADILLLIATPDLERYLPGKLFDYIAAGRPILVFGSPGEASRVVEELGVGVLCDIGSATRLRDSLELLCGQPKKESNIAVHDWLEDHRRDKLAKRAFDIIGAVAAKRSPLKV